ncbi:FAD-dependent monooxygenase [Solihabitans fulvus]|uniref:FAD-dependent monooxygenase n=1 Tax=Solihabitans fulvus TaxID=1892852 RepID=A0A5B2WH01_9PSEU|nr:FAD-dependent monooxygenase [Solihabitans fulvus]KAA2249539.1 FAD-dependent monooxygenase [Solihabitans fulvus]
MTHALIIGGGIGGAVTAMALKKAGVASTVYEAYPTGADDVGAFLSIMSNGLDGLRAIDAHQPVLDNSFPANCVEFVAGSGKQLGAVPIGGQAGVLGPRTIKRAALYRVLHDEVARRGIEIEHGKRFTGAVTTSRDRVVAYFSDGSRAEGDLLVGADGIYSTTRRVIAAAAPVPRYLGMTTVCGYAANSPATTPPGIYRMVYGRRAFFGYTTAPDGETWWFASIPSPERSRDELAATTSEQWRQRTVDLLTGDKAGTVDIVHATSQGIVGSSAYDIASTPVWHAGNMVLLGDAAHAASPSAGHGASMAIEDGVVLAQCLRDLPNTEQAFQKFEQLRRERVERLVVTSAKMTGRAIPGPVGRMIRDALLPMMLRKGPRNTSAWLTEYHIEWDTQVGLIGAADVA